MVDCRLCKHSYTIYKHEADEDENIIVCLEKRLIVENQYAIKGPCIDYVDVDGYNPENGEYEA